VLKIKKIPGAPYKKNEKGSQKNKNRKSGDSRTNSTVKKK
jgi:hypothetical protein